MGNVAQWCGQGAVARALQIEELLRKILSNHRINDLHVVLKRKLQKRDRRAYWRQIKTRKNFAHHYLIISVPLDV